MPIKVLQANVRRAYAAQDMVYATAKEKHIGRAYAAQDMVYATAKEKHIDILVIGEPNKKRVAGDIWIKDRRVDVAAFS
ncbi:hypothetical protein QE152_g37625 [Popillia japonica]|uniref:Uncharacterized protein n=1 Tax=Popillia japonica TaxID=7064 RepID=A0AAW1I9N4_POPJA